MGRLIAFKVIIAFVALTLLAFEYLIWVRLVPGLRGRKVFSSLRIAYWAFALCGQAVLWFAVLYPGRGMTSTLPHWYQPLHGAFLAINYSHFVWLLPLGIFWLLGIVAKRLRRGSAALAEPEPGSLSRRSFLKGFAGAAAYGVNLLPAATSAAAISGIFLGSRQIETIARQIQIPGLHEDLKGVKIVQISDIHIGNLIGDRYLDFTLGLINSAKPDYVVVTGDIIDNNNAFLPVATRYFSRLADSLARSVKPRSGSRLFGVLGNHDLIDDGLAAAAGFARGGLRMLRNEAVPLRRGNGMLQLAGLDYPMLGRGRQEIMRTYFDELSAALRPGVPTVLLNHNPADFEFLKTREIDLVLSGHTHGGQINFSQSQKSPLNVTGWVYKYYVDHYVEGGKQLYVNRGLGHWFPLRVNCPPEITVLTLI